jgi:hypothetical protein
MVWARARGETSRLEQNLVRPKSLRRLAPKRSEFCLQKRSQGAMQSNRGRRMS